MSSYRGVIGHRKQRLIDLEERASRAEAALATAARLAVVQERTRIAREMHDIVAHGMSTISVQAAAGQVVAPQDLDRAVAIFASIEDTGREALIEMRRMLGVLRDGGGRTGEFSPQPSLRNLDDAIDHCVLAGLPVELSTTGEPRRLAPGIELAGYRIIQEALTNSLKHGGDATVAFISVHYGPEEVSITITDTGRGAVSSLSSTGGGNGLLGMRERVDAYQGDFTAGPKPGGGYEVRARLPMRTPTAERYRV